MMIRMTIVMMIRAIAVMNKYTGVRSSSNLFSFLYGNFNVLYTPYLYVYILFPHRLHGFNK